MTIEKCQNCANYGVFGACRVEQTTSGDWSCNFIPKNGSATLVISSTTIPVKKEESWESLMSEKSNLLQLESLYSR